MGNNQKCSIEVFSDIFAGKFSNKLQAQKDPKNFAHINIYVRRLPFVLLNANSFYSEQSYEHSPWSPYRQAVHILYTKKNMIILSNYKIKNAERVAGAGFNKDLIKFITREKLNIRSGCEMQFTELREGCFRGKVEPGCKCLIKKDGKTTYLASTVEVDLYKWISLDEGYDISNDHKVWGSNNGPMEFIRVSH